MFLSMVSWFQWFCFLLRAEGIPFRCGDFLTYSPFLMFLFIGFHACVLSKVLVAVLLNCCSGVGISVCFQ